MRRTRRVVVAAALTIVVATLGPVAPAAVAPAAADVPGAGGPSVSPPVPPGTDAAAGRSRTLRYRPPVPGSVLRRFAPPRTAFGSGHRGVDLAAAPDAAVGAAAGGTVTFAGTVAGVGWISVAHADGVVTSYGPIGAARVARGQTVSAGQELGRLSPGGHGDGRGDAGLHWGARRGGAYLDPLSLLDVGLGRPSLVGPGGWRGIDHAVVPYEPWAGARLGGLGVAGSPVADRPGFAVPPGPNRLVLVAGLGSDSDREVLDPVHLGYDAASVTRFSYRGLDPDGAPSVYGPQDTFRGVDEAAARLATQLRDHAAREPGRAVDLVGHSMGGAVVGYAAPTVDGGPMASQDPPRIGVYARLSVDRDGDAASPDRQVADCRSMVDGRGWQVAEVYIDRNLSGFTGERRPAFDRMLADLEAGRLDGVAAWKLDRLSRNRRDWHRLAELVDAGALLACVHDPVDTSTPLGTVVVDMLASMARAESAATSLRVSRAMEDRARAGKPHTAGRVFGYTPDYQLVPTEAAAARDAAGALLAGASLRQVAADLNRRGILTAGGNRWSGTTLRRTLTAPTLAGIRVHHDTEYPGTWPPVLDRTTWERLRALLKERAERATGGGPRVHLLSGLAVCGTCGTVMHGHRKPDGTARYRCVRGLGGCGRVGILTAGLDRFVRDAVLYALDGPGLADALRRHGEDRPDTAAVVAELDAAESRLERLSADHYGDGLLTRGEFLAGRDRLSVRIGELRAQLEAEASTATLAELVGVDLDGWWDADGRTNDERRAVLDTVLEAVEVGPWRRGGRGWDPERVTLRWRV